MIKYVSGDIFNSKADVIVNPVNLVGIMGAGLAKQFKERYSKMFSIYKKACNKRLFVKGTLMLIQEEDHRVLLFPTKNHWKDKSELDFISKGLLKFVMTYQERGIKSVAFPRLGCGLGGLKWEDVKPIMELYLENLPIDIYIYSDEDASSEIAA